MPRLRLLPEVDVVMRPEDCAPVLEYLLRRGGPIGIDTETTGLRKLDDVVKYWSMATEERRFFLPWQFLERFRPLLTKQDQIWYLANAKFDAHMIANMGIELGGQWWDIMIMDAMDDDTRPHRLKSQAFTHFGVKWAEFKETFLDPKTVGAMLGLDKASFSAFKKKIAKSPGEALEFVYAEAPEVVENYATCDAYFTYAIADLLRKVLEATPTPTKVVPCITNLFDYFQLIEQPLTHTLWRMERRGVLADVDYAESLAGPMLDGLASARREINLLLGNGTFDPRKKDDLRALLFTKDGFGLKPMKTSGLKAGVLQTKSAPKPAVDVKDLLELQERVGTDSRAGKFITHYVKWAKIDKLYGTYVEGLRKHVSPTTGRVHTNFNQHIARTTRLSSSDPNLQNIPVRNDKYGLRGIFVAARGKKLISRDYPQIEFRVAAALSGQESMMADIRAGLDIHTANAARMYGKKFPDVTYEAITTARKKKDAKEPLTALDLLCLKCREGAKTTGLGTMYGEGKKKIALDLGVSDDEAQEGIDLFFNSNQDLARLIDFMHEIAEEHGISHTWLGRMRRLHRSSNHFNRGIIAAEMRQAFNCLDAKTEALTTRGWVPGLELVPGDVLLTKNATTGILEWQPANIITQHVYTGELVEFTHAGMSAMSTPDHRWLVDTKGGQTVCKTTDKISPWGDDRIHRTGTYVGPETSPFSDDMVELLGWVSTDGSFKRGTPGTTTVTLYQSPSANPQNCERIEALLERMEIAFIRREYNGVFRWEFHGELGKELRRLLPKRELTLPLLLALTGAQLQLLLRTVVAADGHTSPRGYAAIAARSQEMANVLQILASLTGKHAVIRESDYTDRVAHSPKVQPEGIRATRPVLLVAVLERSRAQVTASQRRTHHVTNERLWCPVVPNTYFIARREGHVYVTGNCVVQGSSAEMLKLAMLQLDADPEFREVGSLLLTVHDELISEADEHLVKRASEIMDAKMSDPYRWRGIELDYPVPVPPDGGYGDRWSDLK
jgi:DNA polymerase I-like protein with 3'-5' exonuclease and polymerase domains